MLNSADYSVILNEVKDLTIEFYIHQPRLIVSPSVRSLACARDDIRYFFSFHFKTTPCITPPISSSFSL